jgi:hypothetical protein
MASLLPLLLLLLLLLLPPLTMQSMQAQFLKVKSTK